MPGHGSPRPCVPAKSKRWRRWRVLLARHGDKSPATGSAHFEWVSRLVTLLYRFRVRFAASSCSGSQAASASGCARCRPVRAGALPWARVWTWSIVGSATAPDSDAHDCQYILFSAEKVQEGEFAPAVRRIVDRIRAANALSHLPRARADRAHGGRVIGGFGCRSIYTFWFRQSSASASRRERDRLVHSTLPRMLRNLHRGATKAKSTPSNRLRRSCPPSRPTCCTPPT